MRAPSKISLRIPGINKSESYFSFRLKAHLSPEPSIFNSAPTLFAISGIEGNFISFCKILIRYKVIDRYFNWTFNKGHLVILGNCFDKEGLATECLWFIYSLEEKAKSVGGYVHFILGEHELLNIDGNWKNNHPPYALGVSDANKSTTALYLANHELWHWLGTKNAVEKIGNLLFIYSCLITQADVLLDKFDANMLITGQYQKSQVRYQENNRAINIAIDHSEENGYGLLIRNGICYRADSKGRKEKIQLTDRMPLQSE